MMWDHLGRVTTIPITNRLTFCFSFQVTSQTPTELLVNTMAILLSRHWSLGSLVLDIDFTSSYISCDNACLLRLTSTPKKSIKSANLLDNFFTYLCCLQLNPTFVKKKMFFFFKCHVYDETLPPPIFTSKYHNFFLALFHMFNLLDNNFSWDDVELCGVFWHRHGPHLMAAHQCCKPLSR